MKINKLTLLLILFWLGGPLLAQVTLRVISLPAETPADAEIYVAGNFQNWMPGEADWQLQTTAAGALEITFTPDVGALQFKFTRGGWPTVEGDENGNFRPNRQLTYDGTATTVDLTIEGWEDLSGGGGGASTDEPNVSIIPDFYMPQLDRSRNIWIYLPPDYATSTTDYPVLYMHDGQNLFDPNTSFAGEWEVDESLTALFDNEGDPGVIVVGIENGGAFRLEELTPWSNPQYGGGRGADYVDFIVETLKPYIDANYRTLPGPDHTGIMGSSLGGLISMYAAIEHQDVFRRAGIFSPSFWFSESAFTHVSTTGKQADMRFYLIGGQNEGGDMAFNLNRMEQTLLDAGFGSDEIVKLIHPDGTHSEGYWRREFPAAYQWLFAGAPLAVPEEADAEETGLWQTEARLYPNPADTEVHYVVSDPRAAALQYVVYQLDGNVVRRGQLGPTNSFSVADLPTGLYYVKLQGRFQNSLEKLIVH